MTNKEISKKALENLNGYWSKSVIGWGIIELLMFLCNKIWSVLEILVLPSFRLGSAHFFLKMSRQKEGSPEIKDFFWGFRHIVKSTISLFFMAGIIILGLILLIIPGIIASIRLSMVFFILAENPDINTIDALNKSNNIMKGLEWQYFCLLLWFLLLALLCVLTFGIGFYFLYLT